jgi:nucleoside-diphosphate-sugar epimerase
MPAAFAEAGVGTVAAGHEPKGSARRYARAAVKIFFAGATGALGRRLLPMLIGAGHEVTAMTRSDSKIDSLRSAGAAPVVCDVFDAAALRDAVMAASPEVLVHELTDLPQNIDPRKAEEQTKGNDRIRTEGTKNLVDAALAAGTKRMVAQSISFAYAPVGGPIKTEDDPLFDDSPWPFSRSVQALHDLEDAVTKTPGIGGLVLRYGFFYGPGTGYAANAYWADQVRKRRFPIVGSGAGIFSYIHVDDAATATVAAVERGQPGIYNIVDDDPAPVSEWLPVYAEAVNAKKPRRVPAFIARFVAGKYAVSLATELRGASNEKAKRELGWTPRYASWREGFREALG